MKKYRALLSIVAMIILTVIVISNLTVFAAAKETIVIWNGTVASDFASGSGTEYDPYLIQTSEQLAFLAASVNSGITYKEQFFQLTEDLYLNNTSDWEHWSEDDAPDHLWTPIGDYKNKFLGTFDGGGHTVFGMYAGRQEYVGLFGYIGGTVKNLNIVKSFVSGNYDVGGIVGLNEEGIICNCSNSGTVMTQIIRRAGGICGKNLGTVENCCNTGLVNCTDGTYVGGICGMSGHKIGQTFYCARIINCYNTGDVQGSYHVGGICGSFGEDSTNNNHYNGEIQNSYNSGTVIGRQYVGGICGRSNGVVSDIENCYNTGNVIGKIDVGGISGANQAGTIEDAPTIKYCYNTGKITGSERVGGLSGWSYCKANISFSYNLGEVSGKTSVGGICGKFVGLGNKLSTCEKCYNNGTVIGENDVGGISGLCKNGKLENCYNVGNIIGNECVGGICGTIDFEYDGDSNYYNSIFRYCYSVGDVKGDTIVGGICGKYRFHKTKYKSNSYYLIGSTTDESGDVSGGVAMQNNEVAYDAEEYTIGLDEEAMKQEYSFAGFDFESVWTMEGDLYYQYPELRKTEHKNTHIHVFDRKVVSDSYLKSAATETEDAVYYYSCECGEAGTETFTDDNSHIVNEDKNDNGDDGENEKEQNQEENGSQDQDAMDDDIQKIELIKKIIAILNGQNKEGFILVIIGVVFVLTIVVICLVKGRKRTK